MGRQEVNKLCQVIYCRTSTCLREHTSVSGVQPRSDMTSQPQNSPYSYHISQLLLWTPYSTLQNGNNNPNPHSLRPSPLLMPFAPPNTLIHPASTPRIDNTSIHIIPIVTKTNKPRLRDRRKKVLVDRNENIYTFYQSFGDLYNEFHYPAWGDGVSCFEVFSSIVLFSHFEFLGVWEMLIWFVAMIISNPHLYIRMMGLVRPFSLYLSTFPSLPNPKPLSDNFQSITRHNLPLLPNRYSSTYSNSPKNHF